jgi:hypothetical protein
MIVYGWPATVAVDGAPALESETLVTPSLPTRPDVVNSDPRNVNVFPYVFVWLLAVIARSFVFTVIDPFVYVML